MKVVNLIKSRLENLNNVNTSDVEVKNMMAHKAEILEAILEEIQNEGYNTYIPKAIKETNYTNVIPGIADCEIAKTETNDCVVKSIASALNIEYEVAHEYAKENLGRRDRRGVQNTIHQIQDLGTLMGNEIKVMLDPVYPQVNGRISKLTVGRVLEQYTSGTYLIAVKGHMFTIKDGVVIGNLDDSRKLRRVVRGMVKIVE